MLGELICRTDQEHIQNQVDQKRRKRKKDQLHLKRRNEIF